VLSSHTLAGAPSLNTIWRLLLHLIVPTQHIAADACLVCHYGAYPEGDLTKRDAYLIRLSSRISECKFRDRNLNSSEAIANLVDDVRD